MWYHRSVWKTWQTGNSNVNAMFLAKPPQAGATFMVILWVSQVILHSRTHKKLTRFARTRLLARRPQWTLWLKPRCQHGHLETNWTSACSGHKQYGDMLWFSSAGFHIAVLAHNRCPLAGILSPPQSRLYGLENVTVVSTDTAVMIENGWNFSFRANYLLDKPHNWYLCGCSLTLNTLSGIVSM